MVASEAGKNLIPCVLELGGRNPCIVDETADLEFAVRKVLIGRFMVSG